jgi:ribose transport system permease protein
MASAGASAGATRLRELAGRGLLPVVLVLTFVGFGLAEPNVFRPDNLRNILIQASYPAVFATAQMFVLLTRGFDLSLGVTVSMVSVLSGLAMVWGVETTGSIPLALAIGALVGLASGAAVGLVNGSCVSLLGVNPFVVTLGTWNIVLGIATTASGGRQIFDIPAELNTWFYREAWLGIPPPIVMAALLLVLAWWILNHTVLGRALYLIGGNPRAADVAGIPRARFTTLAYVLCSLYVALGALMLTARTGSGEPNLGGNLTLESIAAAVIGGVSLRGGEGAITSPILGALFVTVLSNGMNLLRIDGYIQQMILGAVIIAAIFVDRLRQARA